jgi:hypothetical protein
VICHNRQVGSVKVRRRQTKVLSSNPVWGATRHRVRTIAPRVDCTFRCFFGKWPKLAVWALSRERRERLIGRLGSRAAAGSHILLKRLHPWLTDEITGKAPRLNGGRYCRAPMPPSQDLHEDPSRTFPCHRRIGDDHNIPDAGIQLRTPRPFTSPRPCFLPVEGVPADSSLRCSDNTAPRRSSRAAVADPLVSERRPRQCSRFG